MDAKGAFGRAIGPWLQQWGVSASVVSLGSFQAIYAALGAGKVDAGYLPIDLRFRGQNEFGWNVLHALPTGTGGIVTTRRFITAKRGIVAEVVKGFVDSIHLFRRSPTSSFLFCSAFCSSVIAKAWNNCTPSTCLCFGPFRDLRFFPRCKDSRILFPSKMQPYRSCNQRISMTRPLLTNSIAVGTYNGSTPEKPIRTPLN